MLNRTCGKTGSGLLGLQIKSGGFNFVKVGCT